MRRRMMLVAAATLAGAIALTPRMAVAEGLFELFFAASRNSNSRRPRRRRISSPIRSA